MMFQNIKTNSSSDIKSVTGSIDVPRHKKYSVYNYCVKLLKKNFLYILIFLIFLFHAFVYRDVIFQGRIVFPSNFLVQFYSPWSTQVFPNWEQGIPHKPIGVDQFRFFYPSRIFTNESFQKLEIPLWNPYIFSGNPHIADFQSAVFYPLTILYALLPTMSAWAVLIIVEPILAALGMYLYLRKIILNKASCLLGAIAFGFSGFMSVWGQENMVIPHAVLWLPFILWAEEGFIKSGKLRYFFLGALFLSLSFLAGFFQITFYIFAFSLLYGMLRVIFIKPLSTYRAFLVFIMFPLSLLISSVQLLPSIEGFYVSSRITSGAWYLFETYMLPITHIINLYIPDIFGSPGAYNFFGRGFYHETVVYIGVIPLMLALFSFKNRRKNFFVAFFLFSAFITFFLTIASPLTSFFYKLPLPLITTFVPSRILILTTFSLSVLAGFGMQEFLKEKKFPRGIMGILAVFILLSLASVVLAVFLNFGIIKNNIASYIVRPGFVWEEKYFPIMIRNIIFQLGFVFLFIAALLLFRYKKFLAITAIVIALIGQFYYLQKYINTGRSEFLYPPHPIFTFLREKTADTSRFIALGKPIIGNISTVEKVYSPGGLDPIFSNRYGQLVYAAKNDGRLSWDVGRIEVDPSDIDDSVVLLKTSAYMKILNLLGVKYVLYFAASEEEYVQMLKRLPSDVFLLKDKIGMWYIYENKEVLPRAYLVYDYTVAKKDNLLFNALFSPKTDLAKTAVLEENPGKSLRTGSGSAYIAYYSPNKVIIKTASDREALLFLSDTYYPGWKVNVDSKESKMLRANFTFRGVFVPSGNHTITFVYRPASFYYGYILTLASFFVLTLAAFVAWKRRLW